MESIIIGELFDNILAQEFSKNDPNKKEFYIKCYRRNWFEQCEKDLKIINRLVKYDKLKSEYRNCLRDKSNCLSTLYEIRFIALIAEKAKNIEIHPKTPNKNGTYDLKANINENIISIEIKLKKDTIFERTKPNENGIYSESRATVDEKYVNFPINKQYDNSIPKSTEIRELIENAFQQLPFDGINFVAIGDADMTSDIIDFEDALFGDSYIESTTNNKIERSVEKRTPSGIFYFEQFNTLSGAIWFHINNSLNVEGKVFYNPNAKATCDNNVQSILNSIFTYDKIESESNPILNKL